VKLINQKTEKIEQDSGLTKKDILVDMFKHIERCARTCYLSEDKITDKSYIKMIHNLIANKHFAMLEFGTMYFKMPYNESVVEHFLDKVENDDLLRYHRYDMNDYIYITTNFRHFLESKSIHFLIKYLCSPTEYHERRYTYKFTTNRAIANELVRHRVFSFAQESTRFCNYSKGRFGKELTFIKPYWIKNESDLNESIGYQTHIGGTFTECTFKDELLRIEKAYLKIIGNTNPYCQNSFYICPPEGARDILPLALKTEICMCGFKSDWDRLYDVRVNGVTGTPHPMIKELISMIR